MTAPSGEERQVPLATGELPTEMAEYVRRFNPVFERRETFENACAYVVGLVMSPRVVEKGYPGATSLADRGQHRHRVAAGLGSV